ncbi:unnamed protein product (macronuclear) [Paramecium tetraurelia]|uniref:Uncharacterized protein n=1 Tax=Paramecium tetraurelia TaxID=5888 RepID=A0BXS6_PARTE|nr:uncharacterized protein GSPATT00033196001 [Paramecium tetraurelia]CAK63343.1 unnamed protein product [Paramecium tetraurelia]|eukprot:XP_001430741.1 hypothetical protein (macronuclear) [Paramecium tetraurelia strain d4-2]
MIILTLLLGVCAQNNVNELLKEWEIHIEQSSSESQYTFKQILNEFKNEIPRQYQSKFFRMYGQYIFYGLEDENSIDFARALYYFKRSSDLGDINSQFYLSLLTYLNLDGSYNLQSNLDPETKLYRYVKEKYQSISLVDLYFSAIQGFHQSGVAIGFRYWKGVGVNQNCSNSAMFYLSVLEEVANTPIKAKYLSENRQVAKVLYDSNFYMNHELDIFGHAQIFENLNIITHESAIEVKELAYNYYYGLNGLRRNFAKAYQLFYKLYEQLNEKESGIRVAQMHIENLGVEEPNYLLAFQILSKIETKNQDYLGRIQNALGYMYYKGLGVQKDIIKAQDCFRKAADLQNNDGLFNLGSLYMLPSTIQRERNQQKGVQLIEQAAVTGHAMAQYSLALILLDGVDLFYSCDLAATLLHASSSKGPWADTLKTANYLFQQEQYLDIVDLMWLYVNANQYFLENAAVVMEQNDAFYYDTLHFSEVQSRLDKDPVYQIRGVANKDAFEYLYSDYLQFVSYSTLYDLLQLDSFQLNGALQYRFLTQCAKEREAICHMKLGDYYYIGKYEDVDFIKSFRHYKKALDGQLLDAMKGHVYFNLGLMYALGQGVNMNRTRSREIFEMSINTYSLIPIVPAIVQVQIIDFWVNVYRQIDQNGIEQFLDVNYWEFANSMIQGIEMWVMENCKGIANVAAGSLIVILFGWRLKLINQQN